MDRSVLMTVVVFPEPEVGMPEHQAHCFFMQLLDAVVSTMVLGDDPCPILTVIEGGRSKMGRARRVLADR